MDLMDLPLTTFVYDFGIELLRFLGSERYTRAHLLLPPRLMFQQTINQNAELEQLEDMNVSRQIDAFAR